jgi:RNA polymerase sigma factor for flagellar operon FliA
MSEMTAIISDPVRDESTSPESMGAMDRMVRAIARRVLATVPKGSGIEMSDLIQAGNVGLLQATRTYSPNRGAPLAGYAKFRIRGEMLDTIRRNGGAPFTSGTQRGDETEGDMNLESRIPAPAENSPHSMVARRERASILGQEVQRLSPRFRTLVRLRYSKEFSLREIGAALRVQESRACQLHQSALEELRRALSRRGVRGFANLI